MSLHPTLAVLAALNMFVAVGAGAFGAHALKRSLSAEMLAVWQTAVTYQMVHALGILFLSLAAVRVGGHLYALAAWMMCAGVVLFSGSLYLLSTTGWRMLGPVTPLGGLALLAGWLTVAWAAYRSSQAT